MKKSGLNNQNVARKFEKWHVFLKSGLKKVQIGLKRLIDSYMNPLCGLHLMLRPDSITI
jgi:hypothetical protein